MTNTTQRNRLREFVPAALGDVDNLFEQFFGPSGLRPAAAWRSPLSIWEADDTIHVELDVPGVAEGDVELTFDKGALKISVERKEPERDRKYWHNERTFGQVTRSVTLPESADPESIGAELSAGVLHVTIAKVPEAQPRRIRVKQA